MSVKVITNFPDIHHFSYNYQKWNRQFLQQNIILNGKFSYLYYPSHWTTLSLKFAFGGYEHYILDKIKYGVDDSAYLILNRDSVYESLIDSDTPVETLTLNFTSDFVDDVFHSSFNSESYLLDYPELRDKAPVNFFQKLYPNDTVILEMINHLRAAIKTGSPGSAYINERLHLLLEHVFKTQLCASKRAEEVPAKKRSTRYELYNRLNLAKDYLYSNYSEKIELKELGKIVCLSPHHLLRQFRASFGMTPHKYLTLIRLEKARELLILTDKPVSAVCFEVGFESLSSFGVLFKKYYSLSPENYRFSFSKKSILEQ